MKFVLLMSLLLTSLAHAQIQVPESCVNKMFPCLIRADSAAFKFIQNGYEAQLTAKSIVKITKENSHINFEILKGHLSIKEITSTENTVSVNSVLLNSPYVMASRELDQLEIFSLGKFTSSVYTIKTKEDSVPEHVKTIFLSKSELVDFTKVYFSNVNQFKYFLSSIEKTWKTEFQKQNEAQTKVLMRSVASEEKEAEDRINQKIKEAQEIKKARTDLFFRTFSR